MKTLFNLVKTGVQNFSFWENPRAGLKRNIARIKNYYRYNPTIVPSNHFLVRLLQSIAVPHSLSTDRYYDIVLGLSDRLSTILGMTSPIHKGQLFKNTFYNGSVEILLAVTERLFDVEESHRNWKDLTPVTVLMHPISTLDLSLPDGGEETKEQGIAVISIDIPLLALQYRAFSIDQAYNSADGSAQLTIMQFIRMYVIPNMLESHLDYVIFNRLFKLFMNETIPDFYQNHPIILSDYSDQVDSVLIRVNNLLIHQVNSFSKIIQTLPAITHPNQSYLASFPDIAQTRQINWALIVAKLPLVYYLASISSTEETNVNVGELNRFIVYVKTNNILPVITQMLGNVRYYDKIEFMLNRLEKLHN